MNVIRSASFLRNYFSIFNKKYFDNVLKRIPLEWNDTDTSCFYYIASIEEKKIIPIKISVSYNSSFDDFRNSLVHEMLHYYVNCYVMEFTRKDWKCFVNLTKAKSYNEAIREMLGDSHNSTWRNLARKLNSNKELDIKPFLVPKNKNVHDLHLIKVVEYTTQKSKKEYYFCFSTSRLKKLLKKLDGTKDDIPRSDFFEFELNYDEIDMSCLFETKEKMLLKNEYINYLKSLGTISDNKINYIGTMRI